MPGVPKRMLRSLDYAQRLHKTRHSQTSVYCYLKLTKERLRERRSPRYTVKTVGRRGIPSNVL